MNTGYERRMMLVFLLSIGLMIASFYLMPRNTGNISNQPASSQSSAPEQENKRIVPLNTGISWTGSASVTNVMIAFGDEIAAGVDTYGGKITQVSLNGSWNRKKIPFPVIPGATPYKIGDLIFGSLENAVSQTNIPVYRITGVTNNSVELKARLNNGKNMFEIKKIFTVSSNYQVFEEIFITNLSGISIPFNFNGVSFSFPENISFISPELANSGNPLIEQYYNGSSLQNAFPSGFLGLFKPSLKTVSLTNALWICLKDNYFVTIMRPSFDDYLSKYIILRQEKAYKEDAFGIELNPFSLEPGGGMSFRISYYIGPKKEDILNMVDNEWLGKNETGKIRVRSYYRFFMWWPVFNWFMKPLEWLIVKLMYVISIAVQNWGIIIILLAVVIKLVLSPLSIQAARSIKRSNLLQPKLKSLQERYRNDQQTLNQKIAELYKKEKVNPLGGCLPMLLQIPVFFALLRVLSNSVELKGASFLWMSDLTQPDTLFKMSLPLLPNTFNLLPIIMTAIQIIQMRLQAMKTVTTTQQQNALNTYLLPIIFLFIFWSMPSGLVLYWTIQSVYTIFEQEIINLDRHIQLK